MSDIVPQRESKESMQLGSRCWTERKRKKRFRDQCCKVDANEKSTESIRSHPLTTHRESDSDDRDPLGRRFFSTEYNVEIWNEEIQNTNYSSHSVS